MMAVKLVNKAVLSLFLGTLLLGAGGLVYAQEPRHDAKPEPQPDATQSPTDQKPAEQSEDKPAREEKKPAKQEDTKPSSQTEHNNPKSSEAGRGDTKQRGGQIPADKFRAQFGRQHKFVVHQTTVQGQPRFQYGGFWFTVVDPWPVEWAYTDECYIDDVDGEYFLFDLAHPGSRIALIVVL